MDSINARPATRRTSSRGAAGNGDQTVTTSSSSCDPNSSNNVAKAAASQNCDPSNLSGNSETNSGKEQADLGSNMSSLQPHDLKHTSSQQQEGSDSNGDVEETPGDGKINHFTRSRIPKPRGQPKDEDRSENVSDWKLM
jgi:hypothetical protein